MTHLRLETFLKLTRWPKSLLTFFKRNKLFLESLIEQIATCSKHYSFNIWIFYNSAKKHTSFVEISPKCVLNLFFPSSLLFYSLVSVTVITAFFLALTLTAYLQLPCVQIDFLFEFILHFNTCSYVLLMKSFCPIHLIFQRIMWDGKIIDGWDFPVIALKFRGHILTTCKMKASTEASTFPNYMPSL